MGQACAHQYLEPEASGKESWELHLTLARAQSCLPFYTLSYVSIAICAINFGVPNVLLSCYLYHFPLEKSPSCSPFLST
jgi:hypothetical protein